MNPTRSEVWLTTPTNAELGWLVGQGVSVEAMVHPSPMLVATGSAAHDGLFEHADDGERWLAFEEPEDYVFWQPRRAQMSTFAGRAFALGEETITKAGTYAFDCALNIFADPLDWLRAKRDGIVVLDWANAFDRLRDSPRIAIVETLLPTYRRHMRPSRLPELFVISQKRQVA